MILIVTVINYCLRRSDDFVIYIYKLSPTVLKPLDDAIGFLKSIDQPFLSCSQNGNNLLKILRKVAYFWQNLAKSCSVLN